MNTICGIEFTGSREEILPDFNSDFPYIASCTVLDNHERCFIPWHWHKPVELFYMKEGALEYSTPKGSILFPAGSGGMVNSNVLHMTKPRAAAGKTVQLLHIFDTSFIAGEQGNRIEQKYIMPIVTTPRLEIISLYPENPRQKKILTLIQEAFTFSEQELGYEVKLRESLSKIWLLLYEMSYPVLQEKKKYDRTNEKEKLMLVYIHEHYAEKITIAELAAAAFLSERECFRVFREYLHTTPVEYIKNYRLQMACRMLAEGREPITSVSLACGLGSSSYFGKVFRGYMGCTPMEYRLKWQNSDK